MSATERNGAKRGRPGGRPVMFQKWGKLLFAHWTIPVEALAERLPEPLEPDLFQDQAWVGVVPFTMWGVRASFLPPVPGLSSFHEINVRTYVRVNGVPGVWFFSLDASNPLAVHAARIAYHLPYFHADIAIEEEGPRLRYRATRTHRNAPAARFDATWTWGEPLPESRPGTLQHFLTERYCLFAEHRGRLYRGPIHHPPWPLRRARLDRIESTMVEAAGLPAPGGEPLLYHADEVAVEIWPLESEATRRERMLLADERGRVEPATAPQAGGTLICC